MPLSKIPAVGVDATGTPSSTTFFRGDNTWAAAGGITSGTAVSASGTSVDFTGLPTGLKRITVMFNGVSTNGTSIYQIQLGTSGGVQTTSYVCNWSYNGPSNTGGNITTGFGIYNDGATNLKSGSIIFSLLGSDVWVAQGMFTQTGGVSGFNMGVAGSKSLGATLDRVRITTVNGTDTFDAGTINILYE
jgi:hypothetical protein